LILQEQAEMTVLAGDFDYYNNATQWNLMLNDTLGPDFPIIATLGNHDVNPADDYKNVFNLSLI